MEPDRLASNDWVRFATPIGSDVAMRQLLLSPLPCGLIDQNGRLTIASPGLLARIPEAVGQKLSDALNLSTWSDTREFDGDFLPGAYGNIDVGMVPVMAQLLRL